MNITYSQRLGRFEAEFSLDFDGDKAAAKAAGWKFDRPTWVTESLSCVNNLRKNRPASGLTITSDAKAEYVRLTETPDLSRALTSIIEVICPPNKKYAPYQLAAVEYARLHPHTLIGDEPGVGKTIEAIAIMNDDPTLRKVLVICPAFLKPNWLKELRLWDMHKHSYSIVNGKSAEWPDTDIVIMNYDILFDYRAQIRSLQWDLLIVDEIHKLATKKAARTREVFGGVKYEKRIEREREIKVEVDRVTAIPAHRKVYMTGTPSLNGKPKELWPLLQSIDPHDIGSNWFAYAKRYCKLQEMTRFNFKTNQKEHMGWMWDGRDNLGELQERMRTNFMIRRLKADVLTDLPPKRRMVVPIMPGTRDSKAYAKELVEFKEWAKSRPDALFVLPSIGDFSTRMLEVGLKMVKPCIEIAESELEENECIVIGCYHKEVAQKIAEGLGKRAVLVTGDVPPDQRVVLVERFQNGEFDYLVGTVGAMGVGLTATRAHLMLLPERAWVPGDVTQLEDRIHRFGQTEQCLYKHLVPEGSLMEYQVLALVEKQDALDEMVG
jgi:SNF2 family DNA or RNA helicase